jgi:hypothetical protein
MIVHKVYVISQHGPEFRVVDVKLTFEAARSVAKQYPNAKIETFRADKKVVPAILKAVDDS